MFVKKFEADSLEEALKAIKSELGPDAIILKTTTNKGLKGALKRKKVEITAAISEKNFKQKSVVDNALGDNKEKFYQADSAHISSMINNYSKSSEQNKKFSNSYGAAGLNKSLKQKNVTETNSGLDAFLQGANINKKMVEPGLQEQESHIFTKKHNSKVNDIQNTNTESQIDLTRQNNEIEKIKFQSENLIHNQELKIESLEKKLIELSKYVEQTNNQDPEGVFELRSILKSYGINNSFINKLLKDVLFEFSKDDLESSDLLVDFALREMNKVINVAMPKFSQVENIKKANIVVLISDVSVGQSALAQKIASSNNNMRIIRNHEAGSNFTDKILNINIENTSSLGEIIAMTRKAVEKDQNIIIDYRTSSDNNETKNFINGLKRSFDNIEVILVNSAIHSEDFNRSSIQKYKSIIDGICFNYFDLCVNFGAIFNCSYEFGDIPYNYFGTGEVIPNDIELSSSERILSCILNIK